jgi:hypothetical protein
MVPPGRVTRAISRAELTELAHGPVAMARHLASIGVRNAR